MGLESAGGLGWSVSCMPGLLEVEGMFHVYGLDLISIFMCCCWVLLCFHGFGKGKYASFGFFRLFSA